MVATDCPAILVLDVETDILRSTILSLPPELSGCFKVRSPDDATEADLRAAHLVLVDYMLDKWEANQAKVGLCEQIPNGLALAALLQQRSTSSARPVAFAIHSSHLAELTDPFPHEARLHLLARIFNIDWAFEKDDRRGPEVKYRQILSLATAVSQLPNSWPRADAEKTRSQVQKLLQLGESARWADQAWSEIERAHPPLDELIQRIHGLLFLRWMLQRVLSYPCFLLDETWLAARLAVTPASLRESLPNGLAELLAPSEYRGILADFRGKRWWRMGVEYILWSLSDNRSLGVDQLRKLLIEDRSLPLDPTKALHPVVCLNTDFLPLEHLHDPRDAVRIMPDDWPSFADQAWTTIELALGDRGIRGLVIEADRPRLEEMASERLN